MAKIRHSKISRRKRWLSHAAGLFLCILVVVACSFRGQTNKTSEPVTNGATPPKILLEQNTNRSAAVKSKPKLSQKRLPAETNSVDITQFPRPPLDTFETQVALARRLFSPGSVDGVMGPQTKSALKAFQTRWQLPKTGELDAATRNLLQLSNSPYSTYLVTSNDLARLQPLSETWLGKSQQSALEYETLLELVAEKAQSHPNLVRTLNPQVNWTKVVLGTELRIPDTRCPTNKVKLSFLEIKLAERCLEAFDSQTNLVAHFPCSIARRVEKRPVGELHVDVIAPDPNYTFDPDVFPESEEARQIKTKLILPPGPNNPVGKAWIGLDKQGYGIHGTPNPEQVGRTESHGCFRLANWNATYLVNRVSIGMPVYVRP